MVHKVVESPEGKYFHYSVTTKPHKEGFIKIDVVDNYFDQGDYAFVNLKTGEVKSYSDVALNYVLKILKLAGMSAYDLKPNAKYKFYTEPHSSKVTDVELSECLIKESSSVKKVDSKYLKDKLGYNKEDLVSSDGRRLPDLPMEFFVAETADGSGKSIGYKIGDDYGVYSTEYSTSRYPLTQKQMEGALEMSLESRCTKTESKGFGSVIGDLGHCRQSIDFTSHFCSNQVPPTSSAVEELFQYIRMISAGKEVLDSEKYLKLKSKVEDGLVTLMDLKEYVEDNVEELQLALKKAAEIFG